MSSPSSHRRRRVKDRRRSPQSILKIFERKSVTARLSYTGKYFALRERVKTSAALKSWLHIVLLEVYLWKHRS